MWSRNSGISSSTRAVGGDAGADGTRAVSLGRGKSSKVGRAPLERAGVVSRLLFLWMSAIFKIGREAPLVESDLTPLPRREKTATTTGRVARAWKEEEEACAGGEVRVGRVIRRVFGRHFAWAGVLKFFNDLLGFAVPIQLNLILRFLEDEDGEDYDDSRGYILCATLLATGVIKSLVENSFFFQGTRISIQVRTAISTMVYEKSLRLSSAARGLSTTGEIVNLMQLDAERLALLVYQLHVLWSGLFQIVVYMALLYVYIGPSALAGVACMPLLVVLQGVLMKKLGRLRRQQTVVSDERVKATNEAVQGVRALKAYSWTDKFTQDVKDMRRKVELVVLKKYASLRSLNFAVISASPTFVLVVTFFFYTVVADEVMTASDVFTAIALFDRLRFPLIFLPTVLAQFVEAQVSLRRLTNYMGREEVADRAVVEAEAEAAKAEAAKAEAAKAEADAGAGLGGDAAGGDAIVCEKCTFSWGGPDEAVLEDVTVRVPRGSLTAVIGPVGSGKSSLCEALLRELHEHGGGTLRVPGRVAYAAQSAWILNGSVRENVVFGHGEDDDKYHRVVTAAQLRKDFDLLPDGDRTAIGEKGVNLSGGQKQRVSVARAAYTDADLYIFDDPLSALDAEVGAKLFDACVLGMLGGRTRVMVTNQLHFLQHADQVVVLDTRQNASGRTVGYVREVGSFEKLMSDGLDFASLMRLHGGEGGKDEGGDEDGAGAGADPAGKTKGGADGDSGGGGGDTDDDNEDVAGRDSSVSRRSTRQSRGGEVSKAKSAAPKELITTEERNTGAVTARVYHQYVLAGGSYLVAGSIMFAYLMYQVALFASSLWIAEWTQRSEDEDTSSPSPGIGFWLGVYTGIACLVGVLAFVRQYYLLLSALKASTKLHDDLLTSVLGATSTFFDRSPVGRIVARFSKDMDSLDNVLSGNLHFTVFSIFSILTTLIILVAITPLLATFLAPLFYLYITIMNYYRSTSRELKRLDSTTRSPVYSHFSGTLGGLPTIRAYGVQQRFLRVNQRCLDRNHRAHFLLKMGDRWLALRLELIGESLVFGSALFAVSSRGSIEPTLAGLALVYAMAITGLLGWAVRSFAALESDFNSVERVLYYTHEIPHEKQRLVALPGARPLPELIEPADGDEHGNEHGNEHGDRDPAPGAAAIRPWQDESGGPDDHEDGVPESWPARGEVTFENLQLRYRPDLDLVLRGISAVIRGGEKIGVVGRTGSGKSTTLIALLRMVEACGGRILIDGLDLAGVPLRRLRSRVSIIPQEPTLFSGTLRFNLDPTGAADDASMWDALEKVSLRAAVEAREGGLDAVLAEYGDDWSAGQRQLLCLARAILRRSRVVLLDEASSSLDSETDALIQETIASEFRDSTVITIAHRLNTIITSDRIMVMDDGRLVEFDHPGELAQRRDSHFRVMLDHLGDTASAALRRVAVERLRERDASGEPT